MRCAFFYWDPDPILFTIPLVHWPVLWYGALFALGFIVGFPLFVSILIRYFKQRPEHHGLDAKTLRKKATALTDRFTLYIVLGTLIGARLGHFLFYEHPSHYLQNPLEFFRVWNGGLASHGAVVGILCAVLLFSYRIRKQVPDLSFLRLLDFLSIPTAFGACCIRIGNFINQEIMGIPSTLPWAVVFGHPLDHSAPIPRHPVQLYEALFYLLLFFFLWGLSYTPRFLLCRGKLVGLFLILVFTFRFFVEYVKLEQSCLFSDKFPLTMGQLLSLPLIALGLFFYWKRKIKS